MPAVTARAIGGDGGPILRRQPVITAEERGHPVSGQVELGVDLFGSMALGAYQAGYHHGGAGLQRLDLVFIVTVRTGGRIPDAGGRGPAMHTDGHIRSRLNMAGPAGGTLPGEIQRRGRHRGE